MSAQSSATCSCFSRYALHGSTDVLAEREPHLNLIISEALQECNQVVSGDDVVQPLALVWLLLLLVLRRQDGGALWSDVLAPLRRR